jgi:hypothetical protein
MIQNYFKTEGKQRSGKGNTIIFSESGTISDSDDQEKEVS